MKKPELLAPAGNLEKLIIAVEYGADAVYIGGKEFSLRAGADNFTPEEMEEGVRFAHDNDRRVYAAVNIFAHNDDLEALPDYLAFLGNTGVDGLIVSDPGVISAARRVVPAMPLHLSTQANCTNWASAEFWHRSGMKRVVLSRELSLEEIKTVCRNSGIEVEVFVHGAMCVSYSGRCLLSSFLEGRRSNRGDCAHPCRWRYHLVEEKRPGEYYPVFEDSRGTYILNAHDLCMVEHVPRLVEAGVDAFKIEGRMKSVHYTATVVNVYREAIDSYIEDPGGWQCRRQWLEELEKVSHRKYSTGFFFGVPGHADHSYEDAGYLRTHDFVGKVIEYNPEKNEALVEQRGRFSVGEQVEIFGPGCAPFTETVSEIRSLEGAARQDAPHPRQMVYINVSRPVAPNFLVRRPRRE